MTTTDTSAAASAKSYHDSLMKATRAVIYASRSLKSKVHDPTNKGLTSRITFLGRLEGAVLKQVQEASATATGLEVAVQVLRGYQAFAKEDYTYVSNLGQKVAPQQVQNLQDALVKLSEQIIAVEKFIGVLKTQAKGSTPLPGGIVVSTMPMGSASPGGTSPVVAAGQVKPPATPPLIINLLKANGLSDIDPIVTATIALLDDKAPKPALRDSDIAPLIAAWRNAVDTFTDPLTDLKKRTASPDTSPQLVTLAMLVGLTELHAQLEVLYDQLIAIEESTRVSATSLLSIR